MSPQQVPRSPSPQRKYDAEALYLSPLVIFNRAYICNPTTSLHPLSTFRAKIFALQWQCARGQKIGSY